EPNLPQLGTSNILKSEMRKMRDIQLTKNNSQKRVKHNLSKNGRGSPIFPLNFKHIVSDRNSRLALSFPKTCCFLLQAEVDDNTPAGPVKEAKEHLPPSDPQFLLTDGVFETITIGTLPPLHFLNETVFERTASEREDREKILSFREEKNSDLISGVYEGGLKVWECTYDILEIMEKEGETFSGKTVLDLGCGAGLLGILALKRGARQILFQDYNKEDLNSGSPPPKKRAADLSKHPLMRKCLFYSGDWRTFIPLVLKKEPQPKFDIIFTSETIYNTCYYPALHETLHKLLAPSGLVYLATKSHYFGVGGGLHLFETFVEQRGVFSLDHLWDGAEGLQRHVVVLRFKKQNEN
uniref:protein-histidine N-methyltransferase n=1 Tax=Xiphophorus couchianus TaxID=32473 RepID=A0A3B5M3M5_9TELE